MAYAYDNRARRIEALLDMHSADALLLSSLSDIRWACGFTGSSGLLLLVSGSSVFVTDGRYATQAAEEVFVDDIVIADNELIGVLPEALNKFSILRLLIQSDHLTLERVEKLELLSPSVTQVPGSGLLRELRARKDAEEISQIQAALEITESALESALEIVQPGISEYELATELEYRQKRSGAEGASFSTIVAFGSNSALPHARAGNRVLKKGETILIDLGCLVNGYASDLTRTLFFGNPDERFLEVYDVVRRAVAAAEFSACAGQSGSQLDRAGRDVIDKAGFGKDFVHSLGHGVGLDIHEWPRINKRAHENLPLNSVLTIEPGIYLPTEFGVRIEDMIVLESEGSRRLNHTSTELVILK